ncbi:methyltransferase [Tianweitania aestuarii]|uniref:methyltransferase n=1 Tax=Tianweitania aestuarii TaxID=2814886 RepID=UPI00202305CD|nr:methyltransferase [Tianweitania aestuarii]
MSRLASTAVMARRHEPADSLDYFPTPPWGTRALCHHVLPAIWTADDRFACTAWDPACGEGHMALALGEYFRSVGASDIFPYGFGSVSDFLHPNTEGQADWIVTNPPFISGPDFIAKALRLATRGVAVLVRTAFLEGEDRLATLYSHRPPALIAQFAERLPMHRARWVVDGKSATAYCWLVWRRDQAPGTRFMWIPKSRKTLSRHDDWLRFGGCVDLKKSHPAWRAENENVTRADIVERQSWRLAA